MLAVFVHTGEIKDVQELYCNHEEADTTIWFHVKDSIERFGISNMVFQTCISNNDFDQVFQTWSPDSVVFILGL